MKRALIILVILIILILAIVLIKTLLFSSKQISVKPIPKEKLEIESMAKRLANAIRFKTISFENSLPDKDAFLGLQNFIEESFPLVHKNLQKEVVNEYSLLYTWKGSNPNLKPILLMGHIDVVPITNEKKWKYLPFAGEIADGYIWGRGALDDKCSVLGSLEAVEHLLASNFTPERTIYLSYGHDEEIGGNQGARKIADLLQKRSIEFEFIQDEGLFIAEGFIPGISKPTALVGVAQKGFVNIELIVEGTGGHSSNPPPQTAIGILSSAITKLEKNPMDGRLDGTFRDMFGYLGPEMSLPMKIVFANQWLFGSLIKSQLSDTPSTNASLKTTSAVTVFQGGEKANVLPQNARAIVNFRIHPRDSIKKVMDHVKDVINDPRVKIDYFKETATKPAPTSPIDSSTYQNYTKIISEVFPDVWVAPGLFIASSDTVHFTNLSKNIYRFHPLHIQKSQNDQKRIHGVNERISIKNYGDYIQFLIHLIRQSSRF